MKFLVDMPVTPQAVAHLGAKGHDAVHASAIGLRAKPDSEVLERARTEERIIVTADTARHGHDNAHVLRYRAHTFDMKQQAPALPRALEAGSREWRVD